LPIPSSRDLVPTGYHYVLPDQNGWSRALHFEAAWALLLTGLVYAIAGFRSGHFRRDLLPQPGDRTWRACWRFLRAPRAEASSPRSYNVVQRTIYLGVLLILFPLVIWTGLALSPAFDSAVPAAVNLLGGRQSARTLHFFVSNLLVLFLIVHLTMIALAGFWTRTREMITGRAPASKQRTRVSV
jgi:thiosulfate reductase cytochrome b subunit